MSAKLVVIQGGFPALSATFILDQITGLIDLGFDVEIWSTYDPKENKVHESVDKYRLREITRYIQVPPQELQNHPDTWLELFVNQNPWLNIDESTMFHCHYGANFNLLKPLFERLNNFVLVSFHGYDASRYIKAHGDRVYDYLFKRANLITTPSHYMKDELVKRGALSQRVKVHRYGINIENFKPKEVQTKNEKTIILSVARLVEKKGLEYAISALSLIPSKENFEYRIIGDGPLREDLEKLVSSTKTNDIVKFLGPKSKQEVVQEMQNCDLFLLPSITANDGDQEGIPVALIEASSMAKPTISTYHSGIPELIVHEKSGLLSLEKDVNDIAKNIYTLSKDEKNKVEYGKHARSIVKEQFDISELNKTLAGIFRSTTTYENNIEIVDIRSSLPKKLSAIGWESKHSLYSKYLDSVILYNKSHVADISVIILSWKYSEEIIKNIEKISSQLKDRSEIIFVDNGSNDERFSKLSSVVDVYIQLNENTGAYVARNIASLFASSPILFFLDDDATPADNLIESHLKAYQDYDVVCVRGKIGPKTNNELNSQANHYDLGPVPFPIYADIEGNTSYQAETFFRVGGWDDELRFGHGGVELSIRIYEHNNDLTKQMYCPDALIYHDYAISAEQLELKRDKHAKSADYAVDKHPHLPYYVDTYQTLQGRSDLLIRKTPSSAPLKLSIQRELEPPVNKSPSLVQPQNESSIKVDSKNNFKSTTRKS